jgi:hypothetical protein
MEARDLRDRYSDAVIERIRVTQYPSKELMDRAELTMASRDRAYEYVDVLLERLTKYPSLQLLDRLAGFISRIEAAER